MIADGDHLYHLINSDSGIPRAYVPDYASVPDHIVTRRFRALIPLEIGHWARFGGLWPTKRGHGSTGLSQAGPLHMLG